MKRCFKHTPQRKADDIRRLLTEGWRFWLYKEQEIPVAFIGMHSAKGEIAYLYVLPQKQGQGIGGSLLKHVLKQVQDGNTVTLWTLNSNERAEAIYAHYGFKPTGNVHILNEKTGLLEREWSLTL